jgi:hypothetical protein
VIRRAIPADGITLARIAAAALQLYAGQHPTDSSDRRRNQVARLRDRKRSALAVLEQGLVQRPAGSDPLDTWIEPRPAARLAAFGIRTPAQAIDTISRGGLTWYRRVSAVGHVATDKLVAWLQANESSIGTTVERAALISRAALIEAAKSWVR